MCRGRLWLLQGHVNGRVFFSQGFLFYGSFAALGACGYERGEGWSLCGTGDAGMGMEQPRNGCLEGNVPEPLSMEQMATGGDAQFCFVYFFFFFL